MCQLKARYRWCLTGTPVHNSLDDFGALLSFVRVHPFREKSQFMAHVVKPMQDRHAFGIQRFQELVRATCLRRTKHQTLATGLLSLPHRTEKTCTVYLHAEDQALYDSVKGVLRRLASGLNTTLGEEALAKAKEKNIMVLLNSLRLICNHGEELVPNLPQPFMEKVSTSIIDEMNRQICTDSCSSCGREADGESAVIGAQGVLCIDCANKETTPPDTQMRLHFGEKEGNSAPQPASIGKSTMGKSVRPSAKVVALLDNLRKGASISDQTYKPRKRYIPDPSLQSKTKRIPNLMQRYIHLLGQDA